jgi:hypothetical protein
MHPTDVINVLTESGGFSLSALACQGNTFMVWSLSK